MIEKKEIKETKLVKPGFLAGKERDFSKYMKNLAGKIALISHASDLDGIASAKLICLVFKPNTIKLIEYRDLNDSLVLDLKKEGFNKVIFIDLMIKDPSFLKKIEEFSDVLIIDHHPFEKDFNSKKTVYMNAKEYCSAYIAYYLFSKIKNLEVLDWLVACASISDNFYARNKKWMQRVFEKYGEVFALNGKFIKEEGKLWNLTNKLSLAIVYFNPKSVRVLDSIGNEFGQIGDLEKFSMAVENEMSVVLNKFDREKQNIKEGYFFDFECIFPIKALVINKLNEQMKDKTLIVGEKKGESYTITARRADGKVDLNKLLGKLTFGFENASAGGHKKAAAGNFPIQYLEEFKKRVKNIK